jgi:hypothetical protein
LPDVFAEFLSCGEPVGTDVVAEVGEGVFEVEFVLFEPGDIEVLAGGPTFKLAGDIFVVVTYNSMSLISVHGA